jgi:hypothetical protein
MAHNKSGNAYGLTALIPIKEGVENGTSFDKLVRDKLQNLPLNDKSPMAKVPNTYISHFYLLNDVIYEGGHAIEEHLKNKYLVFSSNFHGDLDEYLTGMWEHAGEGLRDLLQYFVGFEKVNSVASFIDYVKRCQVGNSLFFVGSNDKPLAEQLKALYLKQAFSHFAYLSQQFQYEGALGERRLQDAFRRFVELARPDDLTKPTWPVAATQEQDWIESEVVALIEATKEAIQ